MSLQYSTRASDRCVMSYYRCYHLAHSSVMLQDASHKIVRDLCLLLDITLFGSVPTNAQTVRRERETVFLDCRLMSWGICQTAREGRFTEQDFTERCNAGVALLIGLYIFLFIRGFGATPVSDGSPQLHITSWHPGHLS
jgi:hypothetical protein